MKSPMPAPSVPPAPVAHTLTDEETFDLKCIRYRNTELARMGCGDPKCSLDTCAVARHARLTLRALAALDGRDYSPPEARKSARVRKHT